jgi:hypothetical protein
MANILIGAYPGIQEYYQYISSRIFSIPENGYPENISKCMIDIISEYYTEKFFEIFSSLPIVSVLNPSGNGQCFLNCLLQDIFLNFQQDLPDDLRLPFLLPEGFNGLSFYEKIFEISGLGLELGGNLYIADQLACPAIKFMKESIRDFDPVIIIFHQTVDCDGGVFTFELYEDPSTWNKNYIFFVSTNHIHFSLFRSEQSDLFNLYSILHHRLNGGDNCECIESNFKINITKFGY